MHSITYQEDTSLLSLSFITQLVDYYILKLYIQGYKKIRNMERKLTCHTDCVSVVSTRHIKQVCEIPEKPVTWGNKFYMLARNIFKHNYRSFP